MVKDIETLNGKLMGLQNEINRLTQLQQKQYQQQHAQANALLVNKQNSSFGLNESVDQQQQQSKIGNVASDREENSQVSSSSSKKNAGVIEEELTGGANDAFFISFGIAKREKPLALTPKKNLIFIKSKWGFYLLW